jgi:hypothetical protein
MRINDPTINPLVADTTCYGWVGAIVGVIGGIVGAVGSIIGGSQAQAAANAQAAAQMQQAENERAIALYNSQIQQQNAYVNYQMALYQAQNNANLASMNQAAAMANANLATLQAAGARQAYNQGLENAKQKEFDAAASRAQARESAAREREQNRLKIASVRAKYAASGVSFEGSPVEVVSEAARLGEVTAQDIAYAGELQSRKELREGQIEKFKAGFALIEEYGHNVEAQNFRNQATRFGYESSLYEYDSALAGAKYRIGLNEAKLTELAGQARGQAYEFAAQQSIMQGRAAMTAGIFGGASSLIGGISSGMTNYALLSGKGSGFLSGTVGKG